MDIDIDIKNTLQDLIKIFPNLIRASKVENEELSVHPSGVYLQNIPIDYVTNLSAIPYKDAEKNGYFKIDLLHLTALEPLNSKEGIRELIKCEPNWELLKIPSIIKKLSHIHNYYETIQKLNPQSVQDLADLLALIRPGKKELLNDYINNKEKIRKNLYKKPTNGEYYFKKSHATAYALFIVLQLHLISADIL